MAWFYSRIWIHLAGAGDLGTSTARWKEVHTQKANVNILTFENNTISTNVTTQI